MARITVYMTSPNHTLQLDQPIDGNLNGSILVKKAYVFWNFNNIDDSLFITRPITGGTARTNMNKVGNYTIEEIASTFSDLFDFTVTLDKNTKLATVTNNGESWLILGDKLRDMLGFNDGRFTKDQTRTGDKEVEVNHGLRYLKVFCPTLVSREFNIDERGRQSSCLINLPIHTNQRLYGEMQAYNDIEALAPTSSNKSIGYLEFHVTDQNHNSIEAGAILLDLYIS